MRYSSMIWSVSLLHGVGAVQDDGVNYGPIMPRVYAAKKPRGISAVF
jgi:hypothetical protein